MEKVLSIVLPVYNVEPYIERCIRSLEDQDLPADAYEIIVVNDGSPDRSRDIVLRLMMEFGNIVLIDQENKGVSMARNTGIRAARGKFLLFVDPDDYLFPHSLQGPVSAATSVDSEVTYLGYVFYDAKGQVMAEVGVLGSPAIYDGPDTYHLSRGDGKIDPDRAWAVLYGREFIVSNELYFLEGVPYLEDGEFLARVLCMARRCLFYGTKVYARTTREGSATNSRLFYEERAANGFFKSAVNLLSFSKAVSVDRVRFLDQPICKFTLLTLMPFCKVGKVALFSAYKHRLQDQGLRKLNLGGCNRQYRLEGYLYNLSPYVYMAHRAVHAPLLKLVKA